MANAKLLPKKKIVKNINKKPSNIIQGSYKDNQPKKLFIWNVRSIIKHC